MIDSDFVIIGDTEKFADCLVCVAGTYDRARQVLARMLNNPTENDKKLVEKYYNLRIEEVQAENCWWRDNTD